MASQQHKRQRGIALLAVMFALLLLTGIAMGLMYMAETETSINYNFRSSQMAYFAAYAGVQEARMRLMGDPNDLPASGDLYQLGLPTGLPGGPNSVLYITNPLPGEVVNVAAGQTFDTELCHLNYQGLGLANPGPNVACAGAPPGAPTTITVASLAPFTGTDGALAYKWVRVTRKANNSNDPTGAGAAGWVDPARAANTAVCWNGITQQAIPVGYLSCELDGAAQMSKFTTVYVITALGITRNGSRRMVSAEVALNPPVVTNGAVESKEDVTLNGALAVSGYDNCQCKCSGKITNLGTCDSAYVHRVTGAPCTAAESTYSVYSEGTIDDPQGKGQSLVSGVGDPSWAENQQWKQDIDALVEDFKTAAGTVNVTGDPYNWTCSGSYPGGTCGNKAGQTYAPLVDEFGNKIAWPELDPDNPGLYQDNTQITYVPGDLHISGNGSFGSGVLVIDGDLNINGGFSFYGLIIVRGIVQFTGGGSDGVNIVGAVLSGETAVDAVKEEDTVLGGSVVINFDKCALTQNTTPQPPRVLAMREQVY